NTPKLHNMVVCTLCSCYPWSVLGLPPVWYKSAPYRSRAVMDPGGVLRDFGVEIPLNTEIRVWDSTAQVRYLVLSMRPLGTDGCFLLLAAPSVRDADELALPMGGGKTSPISAVDVARAVSVVLDDPTPHIGKIYNLTGFESADLEHYARLFSE